MRGFGASVSVALSVVAAVGCSAGQDQAAEGSHAVVLDSAGVEIVINRVPPSGFTPYAIVDSVPDLDVGFVPGDETSALSDVNGAVTMANGDVAVANGRTLEVRFYGSDGSKLGAMGQQGFDKGEFWSLARMGRVGGDTLWAADHALNRLTVFLRGPGLQSTGTLPEGYSVSGRFGDGSYLLVPRWPVALHKEHPVDGVRRDPARYLRWWPAPGDSVGDTLAVGVFPHDQILVVETPDGLSAGVPPFGRKTVQAVGPGRFYVGEQDAFRIDSYDPDGTLRQSIRLEGIDLSLTPEQVAAIRPAPPSDSAEAQRFDRFWATVPETRPAYSRILLDVAGNLWVGEHVATLDTPRNWLVFAADGTARGMVTLPAGFAPEEIGLRYILGVVRGGRTGERVVRYGLERLR